MADFPSVAILCGGKATRLYPLTVDYPKALVLLRGEPFLAHQLRMLRLRGVKKIVLCVGVGSEMIKNFAGDGKKFSLQIEYVEDGAEPKGTGGAILQALPKLSENFFILYGDSYLLCDWQKMWLHYQQLKSDVMMSVFENANQWDVSNAALLQNDMVYYNKSRVRADMKYIDYGLLLCNKKAFSDYKEPFDLAELLQNLSEKKSLFAHVVKERFYEIGSFSGIEDLEKYLLREAL
jgi:NDP-sugar pyrophosphorylase family protein